MPPDPASLARITRLLSEIDVESSALDRLHDELKDLRAGWSRQATQQGAVGRATLLVACVDLHGYYTALEALLERVARAIDEDVPTGPSWHTDLVTQMALEVPGLRPAVIPKAAAADLHELRKFRHFFRNVYVLDPDAARVLEHVERVLRVHPALRATVAAFRSHFEQVLTTLAR